MTSTIVASPLDLFTAERSDGRIRLDLHVPGIHCAGCIRKIETACRALASIEHARVNFTTRRLTVEWIKGRQRPEAIVAAVEELGFEVRPFVPEQAAEGEAQSGSQGLLRAMVVAGFASMNVMLLSISVWSGANDATRDLFHAISAVIAIPAIAYAGRPFFASAWQALRRGRTNMDVPISIGVILATAMSLYETLHSGPHAYFDGATSLLFFLLIGRYLDSVMRDRARTAVSQLLKQTARGATTLLPDGSTEYRPIEAVAPGMRVLVSAGDRIPVDGVVEAGRSAIDRSLITGESLPDAVGVGDRVLAGTLNIDGPLTLQTTAVGEATFMADVVRLMEVAEGGRARYVRLADRASRWYAPVVHLTALLTAAVWLLLGSGVHMALTIAAAVLIITCPCALGLAVPAVQVTAAGVLMRRGILIKDGGALERLAECDTVVFDKTGTLTLGRPVLAGKLTLELADASLAAALASRSTHPLSRALFAETKAAGIAPAALNEIREHPGLGLEALIDGTPVRLGRPAWVDPALATSRDTEGLLQLAFRRGEAPAVVLGFRDDLRTDAADTIATLRASGMDVRILSGDRVSVVAAVASGLGVRTWGAECSPADKVDAIRALQGEGRRVLVVGDGLNDGPALSCGHASMAPSTASDVGQTAADLVFLGDGLSGVTTALHIARRARRRVLQNFVLAIGYNVIAVPVAMLGHATPLIAAVAMSTSSILVIANALSLRIGVR
jgi:Cu2+-exporting ATPase